MSAIPDEFVEPGKTMPPASLAPWQHTVFLLGVLALWAAYGALHARISTSAIPLPIRYISSIVMQSLLVGSTLAGIYHRRAFLFSVFGRPNLNRLYKDFVQGSLMFIAGMVMIVCVRFVLKFTPLHGTYRQEVVHGMLPQTGFELALWVIVGIAAGTGEEFIFRGYLQKQLAEWFGNVPAAIVTCAVLFGCLHFYQGFEGVVAIGVLGALYGVFASRTDNLRGVMIAHSLQDITAGAFHFFRHS